MGMDAAKKESPGLMGDKGVQKGSRAFPGLGTCEESHFRLT